MTHTQIVAGRPHRANARGRCLLVTLITLSAPTWAADWPTEAIGQGSVSLERVGCQLFDWEQQCRSERSLPQTVFVTDNMTGPIPSNDWANSVIVDQYSKALYAHPLTFMATPEGFEIGNPPETTEPLDYMGETVVRRSHIGQADLVVKPSTFSPPDARADRVTDWSYRIVMGNGTQSMAATIGHGLPFAYFEFEQAEPRIDLKRGTQMEVVQQDGHALQVRVLDPVTGDWNHYGLFAPEGTQWTIGTTSIAADLPTGRDYLSVAGLPDGQADTFDFYQARAYNVITDTQVDWQYNETQGKLYTHYTVTLDAKPESMAAGTVMALYPHQWRNLDGTALTPQYDSIRGVMKTVAGTGFTTVQDFHGILPSLPVLPDSDATAQLTQHLTDYYGYGVNLEPQFIQPGVDGSNSGYDTYWLGKNLNRLYGLISIADMLDDTNPDITELTDTMFDSLKGQLEYWFDADKSNPDNYFYYDQDWGTLVGYPASYNSDTDLNDHHFHYGYWIQAAAQIALRDPQWAEDSQWGGMVTELIHDIANPVRGDSRYPFLRAFDPYEGHSWASGTVPHQENTAKNWSGGNNQEASSEAINAWAGLILWGEATGDTEIRDLGIYLYTQEVEAANSYWLNLYGDLDNPAYGNVDVSRVWGGGYDHSTWWTEDPIQTHGINMLPITGASMYLGKDPDYVQTNFDAIWTEYALWDGDGGMFNKEEVRVRWQDIVSEYLAFTDPDAALERWKDTNLSDDPVNGVDPALGIEFGESRAHTYHHMKTLQLFGQPDFSVHPIGHALGLVFNKNGEKIYVAYNSADTTRTLAFSDGMGIEVAANSLGQGTGFPVEIGDDGDNDGIPDTDDLCPNTPAGTPVDSDGCALPQDSDGDGVNDEQDLCPGTPAGTAVDSVGCALPQDSDGDGVNDDQDQCPGTPAGTPVDSDGCALPQDSDGDGVNDDLDQCPGTPAGANVDDNGCEIVELFGVQHLDSDSAALFVNTTDWADAHYTINQGGQLNVRMVQQNGRNEWVVDGLSDGDRIDVFYTYLDPDCACVKDSQYTTYHHSVNVQDTDGDGVADSNDQCPGTPAGTTVDNTGCALPEDNDGDGVPDTQDQCPGTPTDTPVDANGCALTDSDGDGVYDNNDLCPGTPAGTPVHSDGCPITDEFGVTPVDADTALLFVNSDAWADAHYQVNQGGQLNVRMIHQNGRNEWFVDGLQNGDRIDVFFTYYDGDCGCVIDSETKTYVH